MGAKWGGVPVGPHTQAVEGGEGSCMRAVVDTEKGAGPKWKRATAGHWAIEELGQSTGQEPWLAHLDAATVESCSCPCLSHGHDHDHHSRNRHVGNWTSEDAAATAPAVLVAGQKDFGQQNSRAGPFGRSNDVFLPTGGGRGPFQKLVVVQFAVS